MDTPIVLVPGFWIGAWAWDQVATDLRASGHTVVPLTLPGLDSVDTDRSSITLEHQVDAIVDAIEAAGPPVVLAVHSGAAVPGYAVTDRIPDKIAAMIYVDTAPPSGALDPDFAGTELPMPSIEELAKEENFDGLSEQQLATFSRRAIPQPGAALRDAPILENDARLDVPSTVICAAFTSEQYQEYAKEGHVWMGGLNELRNLTYVDLPTSHWPMWSRPHDLAELIAGVAADASPN
ncbi:MAG: alpha/beta hydrolase [Acidimicrobiia bacterium]|nr:alpha/beta hydrolase [Acidimicrobiia bacterium]